MSEEDVASVPEQAESAIPPSRVAALALAGEVELIDVRLDYEWDAGRLPGSRNIEMNRLTAAAGSIPRERTVIFYCRGGGRSQMAAQAFREAGYDAHAMEGGITAWVEDGQPLEPADGEVAGRRPV